MFSQPPRFFQDTAPLFARLAIWNKKFATPLARLRGTTLQKISASLEGYLILGVYKPGDDRSAVIMSLKRGESGISTVQSKPPGGPQPNSLVQMARKYLQGRKIVSAYASLDPVAICLEFGALTPQAAIDLKEPGDAPDMLILDLDCKPPRVCVAKKYDSVPARYDNVAAAFANHSGSFYESFCEWSLDQTRTKRRATFDQPLLTYCIFEPPLKHDESKPHDAAHVEDLKPELIGDRKLEFSGDLNAGGGEGLPFVGKSPTDGAHAPVLQPVSKPVPVPDADVTLQATLASLPTHVRRATRTRLQFLERRIQKQRGDLPAEAELTRLSTRAEALRSNLYLWPKGSNTWYVPPHLIESAGLPAMLQLKHGQKPGGLLDSSFLEVEKLKRRQGELLVRIAESEKARLDFLSLVLQVGEDVKEMRTNIADHLPAGSENKLTQELAIALARSQPESARRLAQMLDLSWMEGAQKQRLEDEKVTRRLPYRAFRATTGEFIRVAKSSVDGDAMLKLMPAHHSWLHVLTGEGSHVWLEKPKKAKPTLKAIREAAILAVHFSKHGRSQAADVRVATRADVEKKKDLAPGKVIIRRSETLLVKYEDPELQGILATNQ